METKAELKKSNINGLINLKARMIESFESQGMRKDWQLISINSTGIYEVYKTFKIKNNLL